MVWTIPSFCGYKVEYYDATKDPIDRVQNLIDSWRSRALSEGFRSHAVENLSCKKEKIGHTLTFALDADPLQSRLRSIWCKVKNIQAGTDVDEDPGDTCVGLEVKGENLETRRDFRLYLSIYYYPKVRTYLKYSEK